jgi:hypothetical protein
MVAPTEYKKHIVGATIGRPPLHAIKVCFREAKRLPYNQFLCFRRGGVSPPATKPNNFPNEQGLGGACEFAIAKARFTLAPTVCECTNNSIFKPLVREFFGRGVGRLFLQKRSPHNLFVLTY